MSKPKLNFLTSCTAGKVLDSAESKLEYDRFYNRPHDWLTETERLRLAGDTVKARDLYQGPNADNAQRLRAVLETKYDVTQYIFSAAFGIVHQDTQLPGYACTFSGASDYDRIYQDEFAEWVPITNQDELPEGTLICLPNSYGKAFKKVDNGTSYIIPVDNRAREILKCPSIHAAVLWNIFVAEEGIALNWEIDQWPILSEVLMEEGMEELKKESDAS